MSAFREPKPGHSIADLNPTVAIEWDVERNDGLPARAVSGRSGARSWWRCRTCDYSWSAGVHGRVIRGIGCPRCAGRVAWAGVNDLASQRPEVAAELHPSRNNGVTATEICVQSNVRRWWKCGTCTHEWQVAVCSRSAGSGCPACAGKVPIPGVTDLATVSPAAAATWHPALNGELTPADVTAGSKKKHWWLCRECGHSWQLSVMNRTRASGCPACAGVVLIPGVNDLGTVRPDLAREWSPKNDQRPHEIFATSHVAIIWQCATCAHEWTTTPGSRRGCPRCVGTVLISGVNDFFSQQPGLALSWHPTRNGDLTAADVFQNSNVKRWWLCSECGHEWEMAPDTRIRIRTCGGCANRVLRPGRNDLASQRPAVAAEWHPTKNSPTAAADVIWCSDSKRWWLCSSCGHTWAARIGQRVRGTGCPACAEGGFDLTAPAVVYFLTHPELAAHKVGITGASSIRLALFRKSGWNVLHLAEFDLGADARSVEQAIHHWWRSDLHLPVWLSREDIGSLNGHTETVSADELSEFEVIARIKAEAKRVRAARETKPAVAATAA